MVGGSMGAMGDGLDSCELNTLCIMLNILRGWFAACFQSCNAPWRAAPLPAYAFVKSRLSSQIAPIKKEQTPRLRAPHYQPRGRHALSREPQPLAPASSLSRKCRATLSRFRGEVHAD